jgi:ABC-type Na+ efflux pump permease subunit
MNGTLTVVQKEWRCFIGSDRAIFVVYIILMLSWSIMLATPGEGTLNSGLFWLVFLSVVISANFSNTVFISERVNGTLEILLTSGLSRIQILYGKMAFVAGMSCILGSLCIALSYFWSRLLYQQTDTTVSADELLLYLCAVFMNTASSAFLSVRMSNPRLLHIANLFVLGALLTAHSIVSVYFNLPSFVLSGTLFLLGCLASAAAQRSYKSEKILQPVIL